MKDAAHRRVLPKSQTAAPVVRNERSATPGDSVTSTNTSKRAKMLGDIGRISSHQAPRQQTLEKISTPRLQVNMATKDNEPNEYELRKRGAYGSPGLAITKDRFSINTDLAEQSNQEYHLPNSQMSATKYIPRGGYISANRYLRGYLSEGSYSGDEGQSPSGYMSPSLTTRRFFTHKMSHPSIINDEKPEFAKKLEDELSEKFTKISNYEAGKVKLSKELYFTQEHLKMKSKILDDFKNDYNKSLGHIKSMY